jgi:hypothetical protein
MCEINMVCTNLIIFLLSVIRISLIINTTAGICLDSNYIFAGRNLYRWQKLAGRILMM